MSLEKDTLNELFRYEDGKLFWKQKTKNHLPAGTEAGNTEQNGYTRICINGKYYRRHRLIYVMHNGHIPNRLQIDHIDRNKSNDRIENLRAVTQQQNMFNKNVKGYTFCNTRKKFKAQIKVNGKLNHLGYYKKEDDARRAYINAKSELHKIS